MAAVSSNPSAAINGPAIGFKLSLTLPVLALLATLGALWATIQLWRLRVGTFWARARFSGVVAIALLFLWSLNTWNLLGWRM